MTNVVSIAQSGANNVTMRNRIINGSMVIDQRNAGASVSTNGSYPVDRFQMALTAAIGSTFTAQQSSTAATGFTNSFVWTVGTAGTATGTQGARFDQQIEGYNVADMGFGAAGASTFTLSFWVRSSVTGTYCVFFNNNALDRSYVAQYTISAANTWEQKTITVSGDTSGTWLKTNGSGLRVGWDLGSGSDRNTTAGAWASGFFTRTSSQTNFIGNAGATFYITGVQLEKGTAATPFEQRLYGTELALCQRYYWRAINGTSQHMAGTAYYFSATEINMAISCPMPMRATPTLEQVTGTDFYFFTGVTDFFDGWTNLQFSSPSTNPTQINLYVTSGVSGTSGRAGGIRANNASCSIAFAAEL